MCVERTAPDGSAILSIGTVLAGAGFCSPGFGGEAEPGENGVAVSTAGRPSWSPGRAGRRHHRPRPFPGLGISSYRRTGSRAEQAPATASQAAAR